MKIEEMVVKDIMAKDPVFVEENDVLSKVLSKMKEKGVHEVPVVDEKGKVVGYFDYENLMRRRNIPITAKISTLMIYPPKIDENYPVVDAILVMVQNGLRSLPVVDNENKLVGLVSRTDFTRALLNSNEYMNIKADEIMVEDPITVYENDDVYVAIEKMRNLNEMTLPVVDEHNHLKGTINIDDISNALWRVKDRLTYGERKGQKEKKELYVKDFLNPPVFVEKNAKLKDVIKNMLENKSYVCTVVNNENIPIGIITQKDIIESFAKKKEQEGVMVQITGLETEDPSVFDIIYQIIEKHLKKINKFENYGPRNLSIHIEEHRQEGKEIDYTARAKLVTEKKIFYKKDHDWNLFGLIDHVMESLYRTVRKEKEKEKELRRSMP
ncbi:MAG: CBS domain-containing protein [Thermoplasmata archaeon]|nr:CBS domain-containing protein [Thermoplasmata archaeon]